MIKIIDGDEDRQSKQKRRNNNQLAGDCCCVFPFGLSARIPALAIHKRFAESGWTQQSHRLAFGSD